MCICMANSAPIVLYVTFSVQVSEPHPPEATITPDRVFTGQPMAWSTSDTGHRYGLIIHTEASWLTASGNVGVK